MGEKGVRTDCWRFRLPNNGRKMGIYQVVEMVYGLVTFLVTRIVLVRNLLEWDRNNVRTDRWRKKL